MEAGEVKAGGHRRLLRPVGKAALWIIGKQLGECIHRSLPCARRGRPLPFLFESFGLGPMGLDTIPSFTGKSGFAAFGEFIRSSKLGIPHIAIAGEEICLAIDSLAKLGGRVGKLTRREERLGFRFDGASLLPERGGFEATKAGVQPRASARLSEAGEFPFRLDLLFPGDGLAEERNRGCFVGLG